MAIFTLPTSGPATYRGKYPARARSVSHSRAAGLHVELNDGTRLWTAKAAELPKCGADCSALLAAAVPMTAEQYAELQRAAHIRREAAGLPGYDAAAEESRAILESIQPDKAEAAWELLTGEPRAPRFRFDFDRLSGTGILVRLADDKTSARYTGDEAERLSKADAAALATEAMGQEFS